MRATSRQATQLSALSATLLLTAVLTAGCTTDAAAGSVSLYVKDAPEDDFDEIFVTFTDASVHSADGDAWQTIVENGTGITVDLLDANGTRAAFLGESELAPGNYTMIRINVTQAYGMKDGERIDITVSSGKRPFDVEEGMETRIILDVDLEGSLLQQGNGDWRMTPVIGSIRAEIVDDASSGGDTTEPGEIVEA